MRDKRTKKEELVSPASHVSFPASDLTLLFYIFLLSSSFTFLLSVLLQKSIGKENRSLFILVVLTHLEIIK